MRKLVVTLLAAGSLAGLPAAAGASAASSPDPVAQAACLRARIGGQSKCIARGQFCARRNQRDYRRYGFSCSNLDANGRYHLR
jgi:curli biogenesis system outer membrane secretion channel CsgG